MSHFNEVARTWDNNPLHWERSKAIAKAIESAISIKPGMEALEYGAGTAILSFILSDRFTKITLMDNSEEMVNVMQEKVAKNNAGHLKPLFYDLEHNEFIKEYVDIVYSQMVFHHVENIGNILSRMYNLLKPGGYIAIADLYSEDGSFHDYNFKGFKGFDPDELSKTLELYNFKNVKHESCYSIKRESPNGTIKEYPVFLLTATK